MFVHGPSRIDTHASSMLTGTFAAVLTGGRSNGCVKGVGVGVVVGVDVGIGVAVAVAVTVAVAVAVAVGVEVGVCVGVGVDVGVDVGVGVGEAAETLTTPVIPAKQCNAQKYGYVPACVKVNS
jgi:hypothetical protein